MGQRRISTELQRVIEAAVVVESRCFLQRVAKLIELRYAAKLNIVLRVVETPRVIGRLCTVKLS